MRRNHGSLHGDYGPADTPFSSCMHMNRVWVGAIGGSVVTLGYLVEGGANPG